MNKFILVTLLAAVLLAQVHAHSYITSPTSRTDQRSTQTGCRGPACLGPCDAPASRARAPIQINRGDPILAQWPRNNHAAGFIRFAWAPTAQSDSHAAFDSNVQSYSCHETGKVAGGACAPADASLPNGGDANPADGSRGACSRSMTVPHHLSNGRWTLQWAWFGGAFNLGDYYSCIDYEIVGGPTGSAAAAIFDGGDFTNPAGGACKYFNTRSLHTCVDEPCFNGEAPGQHNSGQPAAVAGGVPPPVVTATAAPQTPVPTATATATAAPPATATATAKPATPVPTAVPTAAPPAAPVQPPSAGAAAGSCSAGVNCNDMSVTFSLTDKWNSGMAAAVRAVAKRPMSSWSMSFKIAGSMKIAAIWNCQLVSLTRNADGSQTVSIKNPTWQTSVAAGQVLDIGFTTSFPYGSSASVNSAGYGLSAGSRAEESENAGAESGSAQQNASTEGGLSTAAAVGIAVGGAAGLAALLAGALIARKKMQPKKAPGSEEIQFSSVATASPAVSVH
jgi:hypothetical protein